MTRQRISPAVVMLVGVWGWTTTAEAQTAPSLGDAASFAVVGATTVTNTGPSVITGNLGLNPGSSVTGFPPGTVNGTIHIGNASVQSAQNSITTAYNALAGQAPTANLTGQDLGGMTLTPGVYKFDSSAQLTGALTLNGQGNPDAVFIFQIGSALTTASGSSVAMINSGSACNVFWQVGSSATLGSTTSFSGNILALASVTLNTGADIVGRAFARTGAVTLDTNNIGAGLCTGTVPGNCPVIGITPETLPPGGIGVPYSQQIRGNSGTAPYVYTTNASQGLMPAGLTLTSTGLLSGTPTVPVPQTFTVRATDARGCFAERTYTLVIGTEVPTLPQIFMIVLTLGLLLAGYVQLRRRQSLQG